MNARNERFDIDNRRGQIGEKLVGSFLEAVADATIEVKTDYRVNETGNVYIETHQCTYAGEWVKSGINTSEAKFYSFAGGCGKGFVTIETQALKQIAANAPRVTFEPTTKDTNFTRGRLVKVADILKTIFEKE